MQNGNLLLLHCAEFISPFINSLTQLTDSCDKIPRILLRFMRISEILQYIKINPKA